jgi:hypothetical protein
VTVRESLVVESIALSRSCILVNRMVPRLSIVDADEADTDVDAADRDTAGGGFIAIDAIAKRC